MNNKKLLEAEDIMCSLTTLTSLITAVSFFLIIWLVVYASANNSVFHLVMGIIVVLLNIPIWKLATRADRFRGIG